MKDNINISRNEEDYGMRDDVIGQALDKIIVFTAKILALLLFPR